nr:MAG TPA: protein of unknown function (DUF4083) [Caudoviricetes sp.]
MYKNIAISLLGAWVLRDVFGTTEVGEQIAIVMGMATVLFIFCLFLENQVEEWQKKQKRIRELERKLEELRGGGKRERRESAGDYGEVGTDPDRAINDAG